MRSFFYWLDRLLTGGGICGSGDAGVVVTSAPLPTLGFREYGCGLRGRLSYPDETTVALATISVPGVLQRSRYAESSGLGC